MATRRYSLGTGQTEFQVVEAVGAAVVTANVEVTVDLSAASVGEGAGTRAILKEEVLLQLEQIKNHILTGNWPPA
jgi:hypothetical protein